MNVLWAANEMEAMVASGPNAVENTNAPSFDSAYTRCSMRCGLNGVTQYIEAPLTAAVTTIWVHWEWYNPGYGQTGTPFVLCNSSGTPVFRASSSAGNSDGHDWQLQFWNGAGWTNIATNWRQSNVGRYVFDLKLVCGAGGSFEFYVGNTLFRSGAAAMGSVNDVKSARFYNCQTDSSVNNQSCVSQIIIADESTVGCRYSTKPPTANGANTAFTGSYADVDETTLSAVDYIEATAANDIETYTGAALALTGSVKAVVVSGQAKRVAGGPQNIQAALRIGGANYFSGNLSGLTGGYAPVLGIFANDPSTAAPWTLANANAATTEFGFKAIA